MVTKEDALEIAAKAAHNINRAYCHAIGDDSQVPYISAPTWQKESALAGVGAIVADPLTSPEQQHELWLEHKRADGWTYGEVKDPEAKTHPCMVPYAELPEAQKVKDALFGTVVRGVLAYYAVI